MSYVNLIMYGAVIPSYNKDRNKKGGAEKFDKEQEIIMMDDPNNRERIKQIFDSFD